MSQSIAVFGAGPGLGQAVAHRYAREGYTVVLVARRQEPLDQCARELANAGATAHVITADLSRTEAIPRLTEQIRAQVGNLDAFYYAPTPGMDDGFIPATHLTPQRAQDFMPLAVYTLLALVREFLPHMLEQGAGAILTAQGASAVQGMPNMSGPGPALAAQRNYLQSLYAEVADKGISVGRLYIGAAIENTPFHAWMEATKAAGDPVPAMPTADPAHLADLLWTMHNTKEQPQEATYPETLFGQLTQAQARPLSERREAAREHLRSHSHLWLATASDGRGPHLIPVSYWWDGSRLTTATFENSRTLRNVRAQPKVRASVGSTGDVLMIDATASICSVADIDTAAADGYAKLSPDPRSVPGFAYIQLAPERMQVWKGAAEFAGRTVMRAGVWLDDPID